MRDEGGEAREAGRRSGGRPAGSTLLARGAQRHAAARERRLLDGLEIHQRDKPPRNRLRISLRLLDRQRRDVKGGGLGRRGGKAAGKEQEKK